LPGWLSLTGWLGGETRGGNGECENALKIFFQAHVALFTLGREPLSRDF